MSVGEQFFFFLSDPGFADDDDCPNHGDTADTIEPNLNYTGGNAQNY